MPASFPADPANAALRLVLLWIGRQYARSTRVDEFESDPAGFAHGTVTVGRRWPFAFALLNTLAPEATLEFEAARAAVEKRLDLDGRSVALWLPRGGGLPVEEPGLSDLAQAVEAASTLDDGRMELRRPVRLYLRRIDMSGSVVTVTGGLAGHWAQFTSRVPGTFVLGSSELLRLPASRDERDALAERIISVAALPGADDTQVIDAEDTWTLNDLGDGGSCVLGSPAPDSDERSAPLRRNLRKLLREAESVAAGPAPTRMLILLGAATYAEEEKLSWAIRGMDPALYAGYDLILVVADGLVRPLLEPPGGTLPWDVPLS